MYRRSSATMPWPDQWTARKRIRWVLALSYLGLMGIACLCLGVAGLVSGEHAHVPLLLLGGLLCMTSAAQGVLMRVVVRRGAVGAIRASRIPETGEAVVVVPYSTSLFWLIFGQSVIILCGVAIPIAAASVSAALDTREASDTIIAVVSLVAAGYMLALVGQFCSKKIARGYVALGVSGVYHRSWAFTSFTPWQHVLAVWPFEGNELIIRVQVAANGEGWSRRTSRFWKEAESGFGPNLTVRGTNLSADPALVYHALQFYFENPHARSELSGDAAVRRLKRADIPVPSRPF